MQHLLRQMLPGLLPLFIFIAADEIWGTEKGLLIALGFGALELLYTRLRHGYFDKFILWDTLFLMLLGAVSIFLENEFFFKLKPAFIELILCVILAVSVFSSRNVIVMMTARYTKGLDLVMNEEAERRLKNMMMLLMSVLLVHVAMIVYSAAFMSSGAWAFISGGLFYIIFALIFTAQLIYYRIIIPWRNNENRI